MLKLFDFNHPFFKPKGRRIATLCVLFGWGAFEFLSGAYFWAIAFWALGAVSFYGLFIVFEPRDTVKAPPKDK